MIRGSKNIYQSNLYTLLLAFNFGWCSYNLKLVSIVKLLDELSFKAYPPLMLILGLSLYGFIKLLRNWAKHSEEKFYFISLIIGGLVNWVASPYSNILLDSLSIDRNFWAFPCTVFLLSSISLFSLEMGIRLVVNKNISILDSPQVSGQVTFVKQLGLLFGAIFVLLLSYYFPAEKFLGGMLSFVFSMALFFPLLKTKKDANSNDIEKFRDGGDDNDSVNIKSLTFFKYLTGLSIIVLLCKNLQGLALLVGMKSWAQSSNKAMEIVFSKISVAQTALILLVLLPDIFQKRTSTGWSKGFNFLFASQVLSMGVIIFFPLPLILISGGALRKIIQYGGVDKSQTLLEANITSGLRLSVKALSQKYSQLIANFLLAFLSFLAFYEYIAFEFLWLFCVLLALFGFWLKKELVHSFNDYHIKTIIKLYSSKVSLKDAIQCCLALSNKEASKHHLSMLMALQHSPKPALAKNIIYALGEMKNPKSLSVLFKTYKNWDRADIQNVVLQALRKYDNEKAKAFIEDSFTEFKKLLSEEGSVDSGLLNTFSKEYKSVIIDICLGKLRDKNLPHEKVIVYLKNLVILKLRDPADDIVNVVRDLVHHENLELKEEAMVFLHRAGLSKKEILYEIQKYREAKREDEQRFFARIHGRLQIQGAKETLVTWMNQPDSDVARKYSSEFALALLKLGHFEFVNILAKDFVNRPEIRLGHIKRIATCSTKIRYLFYGAIMNESREHGAELVNQLYASELDVDEDISIILEESAKRGFKIQDNFDLMEDRS